MNYNSNKNPISTAPRDGTWINVVGCDDNKLYKAKWDADHNCWECEVGGWFEADEVELWIPVSI